MDDFESKLAKEQVEGLKERLEDAPGIGVRPDGTIEQYEPGKVPEFKPKIIDADGKVVDPKEIEDEPE